MKHWYSLQSKLHLLSCCSCTWTTKEEWKCHPLPNPSSHSKAIEYAIQPMTCVSVMLITTWPIMHAKTHNHDQWKKDCCRLSNRDSSFSHDRRHHPSHRRTKKHYAFTLIKKKLPGNLAQEVHSKCTIFVTPLAIKTILKLCNHTGHISFLFYTCNNVCVSHLFSLSNKLISPLYTLHSPSSLSKTLTRVSPDLSLLCNLGTPTVMDTLLRGSEWEPSPTAPATVLSKTPDQIIR